MPLSLLACATVDKVSHPQLSNEQAQVIQETLRRVNEGRRLQLSFTGALQLSGIQFERYKINPYGPRILLGIDIRAAGVSHANCFQHPPAVNQTKYAGRKELSFELMKNRAGDPTSQWYESQGILQSHKFNEDWMCFGQFLPRKELTSAVLRAESSLISTVDWQRGKYARQDALTTLRETGEATLYQTLSSKVDQLLYENAPLNNTYGLPKLARQVGLMQRPLNKELNAIKDAYSREHQLIILKGRVEREEILSQIFTNYDSPLMQTSPEPLRLTQTSSDTLNLIQTHIARASKKLATKPALELPHKLNSDFLLLSWSLPSSYHPDFIPLKAAAYLLAERLKMSTRLEIRLRQRRLGSRFDIMSDLSKTDSSEKMLKAVRAAVGNISSDNALPQLLVPIQRQLLREFWEDLQEPFDMLYTFAQAEFSGGDVEKVQTRLDQIVKLSRNDVVRVLSEYLILQEPVRIKTGKRK